MSRTRRSRDEADTDRPATTGTEGLGAAGREPAAPPPDTPPGAGEASVPPPPPPPEPPPAPASPLDVGPPPERAPEPTGEADERPPEAPGADGDPTTAYGTGSVDDASTADASTAEDDRAADASTDDAMTADDRADDATTADDDRAAEAPVVTEADVAAPAALDEGRDDVGRDEGLGDDTDLHAAPDVYTAGDADTAGDSGPAADAAGDVDAGAVTAAPPPATVGSFVARGRDDLQRRWDDVQVDFVDDPRRAVERADGLVGDVVDEIMRALATEREQLAGPWRDADAASTEDLRLTFQRYRSMFQRLLQT